MKTIFRLLPAVLMILLSCNHQATSLPSRNFSVADVLLQDYELREYQAISHKEKSSRHFERSTIQSASLIAEGKDEDSLKLMQDILQYRSVEIASERYREWSTISEWVPEPFGVTIAIADETRFECVEYTGHHIYCRWAGRYQEFVVICVTYSRSTTIAVEELRRVVRITDARLTDHIRKSATTK
jgi:hypothetical protein